MIDTGRRAVEITRDNIVERLRHEAASIPGYALPSKAADEIERLRGLVESVLAQFDHAGCTCTFPSDDCCAFAKASAAINGGEA